MTIKEIEQILEEGDSLKQIAQAYSEIANLKIKRIRVEVERNRLFFQEISKVYGLVKRLAIKRRVIVAKPKKMISIIITSNYRFYGKINSDLIDYFTLNTKNLDTDRIILGKAAVDHFKSHPVFPNASTVMLKGDQPNAAELIQLVNLIKDYSQVLVFFSKLKSLLVQEPTAVDITATSAINDGLSPEEEKKMDMSFIFEPELSKTLNFFDSQILTLLLEETFLESELARTASRFISMDQAESEANKFITEYIKLKAYAKRNVVNNQLLENFAAIASLRDNTL